MTFTPLKFEGKYSSPRVDIIEQSYTYNNCHQRRYCKIKDGITEYTIVEVLDYMECYGDYTTLFVHNGVEQRVLFWTLRQNNDGEGYSILINFGEQPL